MLKEIFIEWSLLMGILGLGFFVVFWLSPRFNKLMDYIVDKKWRNSKSENLK